MDSVFVALVAGVLVFVLGVLFGYSHGFQAAARRFEHEHELVRLRQDAEHENLYPTGIRRTLGALREMRARDLRARDEADGFRGDDSP